MSNLIPSSFCNVLNTEVLSMGKVNRVQFPVEAGIFVSVDHCFFGEMGRVVKKPAHLFLVSRLIMILLFT